MVMGHRVQNLAIIKWLKQSFPLVTNGRQQRKGKNISLTSIITTNSDVTSIVAESHPSAGVHTQEQSKAAKDHNTWPYLSFPHSRTG